MESYADNCSTLTDEMNHRHLECLEFQIDQHKLVYENAHAKYDKEIAQLEEKLR